ncbi:G-patch domain and KOW motifs-containing protein-like isoform X2 [Bacillus rossius redtenbacheri]|uniref:G-patch domain and KOW motifs-containing protein-like isoform X2 n=1 Tax=Bacillus rossius redtenbacheri TaxID=93214 RepID=UPI002FDE3869
MAEVTKKISFGFTKSKVATEKKIAKAPPSVEYISCFDRKSIILKSSSKDEPVPGDPGESSTRNVGAPATDKPASAMPAATAGGEPQAKTLEQRAAEELLKDAKQFNKREQTEVSQSLVLQIAQAKNKADSEVSSREDYEQVPVENFGLALLRGMGWDSARGIGKKPQVVSAVKQVVRPKGVGLGAEKKNTPLSVMPAKGCEEEDLRAKVGAYLKITSGTHRDKYGKILGFNEDSGRLIVELSCGGVNVSVNESAVQLVTKEHYGKNSRVLNATKYERYMRNGEVEHKDSERKSQKRKNESR